MEQFGPRKIISMISFTFARRCFRLLLWISWPITPEDHRPPGIPQICRHESHVKVQAKGPALHSWSQPLIIRTHDPPPSTWYPYKLWFAPAKDLQLWPRHALATHSRPELWLPHAINKTQSGGGGSSYANDQQLSAINRERKFHDEPAIVGHSYRSADKKVF